MSSTAQRFSVLLKVTDHLLNWRQTPFPLANKELLVFGKGLNNPERRQAGFKTNAQPASAGSQLRSGGGAGWAPGSSPPGGWSPKTVTSQEGLLPHRQDDSLLKEGFTNTGLNSLLQMHLGLDLDCHDEERKLLWVLLPGPSLLTHWQLRSGFPFLL